MNIAVLLTVFNRKEQTLNCLYNLYRQSLPSGCNLDVYLVDDGSTDGTYDAVRFKFPQVNLIKGDGNLFWNRGMHLAWKNAICARRYEYYLWLNDDTFLEKSALVNLIHTSNIHDDKSIVVGTTCAFDDKNRITYGGRSGNGQLVSPKSESIRCEFFNGNIVLIPNYVYNIVGTNDPVFRHSLGDFDYGLRARKKGINIWIAPGVLGKCDNHSSPANWCNPEKSFMERWKAFRSPLGNNPEEFYKFEKRHKGIGLAIYHYLTIHLRLLIPSLWT